MVNLDNKLNRQEIDTLLSLPLSIRIVIREALVERIEAEVIDGKATEKLHSFGYSTMTNGTTSSLMMEILHIIDKV